MDFGYVTKAFSFFKTKLNIYKDNSEYCKFFEGKIQGLVKDPIIFMNSLKINKGIIILYNLDTRQKLMSQLEEINKDSQKDNYLKKVIIFPIIDLSKEGKDIIKQLSIVRFPCYLICKYKTENIFKVLDKIEGIFYLDLFKNTLFPKKNFSYNSSVNINQISNKKILTSENNNQKNHNSSINLKNNINLSNQYYDNSNSKNALKDINNKNIPSDNLKQNNNIIKENKNNINIPNNNNIINKFGNLNNISFPENINNNFSLLNEENDIESYNMKNNYNKNSNNYKDNTNNIIVNNKNNINKNNDNNINSNIKIKKNEIKDNNNNSTNNNYNFVQNKDIDINNINNNNHKNNNVLNNSCNINSINHNNINQNINNKQINISKDNLSSGKNMSNKKEEPKIEKKEYIPDYRDYDFGDELAYYPELDRMYQFPNIFDNTYNNPYNSQNEIKPLSDVEIRNLQDKEMKELERIEEERLKKEKEEKEKKKREEQIEREKIEKEKEEKDLFSMLVPKEPEDNNPDKCIIIFRMPDGEKNIQRKFLKTDKISVLYDYIRSLGKEIYTEEEYHNFSIIQTFPFKNFDDKINNTLEEEGLFPNSVLQIKEIN